MLEKCKCKPTQLRLFPSLHLLHDAFSPSAPMKVLQVHCLSDECVQLVFTQFDKGLVISEALSFYRFHENLQLDKPLSPK